MIILYKKTEMSDLCYLRKPRVSSQTFSTRDQKEIDFQCTSYVCLLLHGSDFRNLNCFLYLKRGAGSLMFKKVLTTISFTNFTHSQAKDCIHPGLLDSNYYLCYEEKIIFSGPLSMLSLLLCTHCDKKVLFMSVRSI